MHPSFSQPLQVNDTETTESHKRQYPPVIDKYISEEKNIVISYACK